MIAKIAKTTRSSMVESSFCRPQRVDYGGETTERRGRLRATLLRLF
jgi:hypothetical protein